MLVTLGEVSAVSLRAQPCNLDFLGRPGQLVTQSTGISYEITASRFQYHKHRCTFPQDPSAKGRFRARI